MSGSSQPSRGVITIIWFITSRTWHEDEAIAVFGAARLVKKLDGKMQLIGGSPEDRTAAKEWSRCSLPEA